MTRYHLSALTELYPSNDDRNGIDVGDMILWQSKITDTRRFSSFRFFRDYILTALAYPDPQSNKFQTYGWLPTEFHTSDRLNKDGSIWTNRNGEVWSARWRLGEHEIDAMSVFVADIDNAIEDLPRVTQQQVTDALAAQGWSCFTYTSYSSMPERPKFRVVVDTSRPISRAEATDLYLVLNETVLGGQGDPSIYDPADFLYAPPHHSLTTEHDAQPMDVDTSLLVLRDLRADDPERWQALEVRRTQSALARLTPEQRAAHAAALKELDAMTETRDWVAADNPDVVRPEWIDDYRNLVAGGHWQTMRSVMAKVWRKSGGSLSRLEMLSLARDIDQARAGYYFAKYGQRGAEEVIGWIMRHPVAPQGLPEVHPDLEPSRILDREDRGIVIDVVEGACGEGKTYAELERIAATPGRYVFATEKIESIRERLIEFRTLAGDTHQIWYLREVHSEESDTSVLAMLADTRDDIRKRADNRPVIIFITHAAMLMADWSAWRGFDLIVDEVCEVAAFANLDLRNNTHLIAPYLHVSSEDGECYRVETTPAADQRIKNRAQLDDAERLAFGVLSMAARTHAQTWITKDTWDNATTRKLQFLSFCDPRTLLPFQSVRLLGDEAMKSVTVAIWRERYGVEFRPVPFTGRQRLVPVGKRLRVYYFSKHRDASRKRLSGTDVPLAAIAEWIVQHAAGERVLWTANKRLTGDIARHLDQKDWQRPRAHGINGLQHYRHVAWMAAMRPSPVETSLLKAAIGIDLEAIVEWREHNCMNQFINRGRMRDFDGIDECIVYVFSKAQADYLMGRYGGTVEYVPGIVIDEPPQTGRRGLGKKPKRTDAKRSRDYRARKKIAAASAASDARIGLRPSQFLAGDT